MARSSQRWQADGSLLMRQSSVCEEHCMAWRMRTLKDSFICLSGFFNMPKLYMQPRESSRIGRIIWEVTSKALDSVDCLGVRSHAHEQGRLQFAEVRIVVEGLHLVAADLDCGFAALRALHGRYVHNSNARNLIEASGCNVSCSHIPVGVCAVAKHIKSTLCMICSGSGVLLGNHTAEAQMAFI